MAKIRIPGDELSEIMEMLVRIRERLDRVANLDSVGTEDDVGDGRLVRGVRTFDGAWRTGHERVQENTDKFREMVDGILTSFRETDEETLTALDPSPAEQAARTVVEAFQAASVPAAPEQPVPQEEVSDEPATS
jgi:hypothetical protein